MTNAKYEWNLNRIITLRNFGAQFLSNNSHNRNLSRFLKNQKRYTQTALISCCFTFVFVVVSAMIEHNCDADDSTASYIIVMICVYTRLLNSFNLVTLFLCRQKDFQRTAIQCFKYLLYGQKHTQPVVTVANHTVL
ncbi:hypothetical protein LOAG_06993 [Loa loa]|uniref:G_PROTEIN_RECEP_F1_2 domain-containing protein n=1 Tax=Loa loa TaxID=7209 RepID=A0A1S0TWW3_LOALO|nr:hypothetical protein LOAG_06993 [Loa loa]EFO21497.1 hypothetical protein LOAG_06993 [Loa loa]